MSSGVDPGFLSSMMDNIWRLITMMLGTALGIVGWFFKRQNNRLDKLEEDVKETPTRSELFQKMEDIRGEIQDNGFRIDEVYKHMAKKKNDGGGDD